MEIKSNHCKLAVCFFFSTFVLLQTSARAVISPGLVNQQEVEDHGFDMQISEAGCLRLLEKIDIDEDLREKAILRVMSSESSVIAPVLRICRAYYDDTSLLVRRLTQLLLMDEQKNKTSCVSEWVVDSYGRKSCKNKLGQTVIPHFPIYRDWIDFSGPAGTIVWDNVGDFIDVNGDGLLDYVVAFIDNRNGNDASGEGRNYYRATFINNGNGEWVMISCDGTASGWFRFYPCQ